MTPGINPRADLMTEYAYPIFRTLARVSNLKEVQRIAQGGLAIAKLQLMNAAGRRI